MEKERKEAEIIAENVTKGNTICNVVSMYGGNMEDTYGFGDSENDLIMLDTCKYSIAMGNASNLVRNMASFVTKDCDDDEITYALHKLGFIDSEE